MSGSPVAAQTAEEIKALQRQMDELREAQAALKKEVQEIREILQNLLTPPPSSTGASSGTAISIEGLPARGQPSAKVTIVAFSDYQCPHSAHFLAETYSEIDSDYILSGKVRYVFKNFPVEAIHPEAFRAHEAAACAGDQGKYWEMHDHLFANQAALAPDQLVAHAKWLGVNLDMFQKCLDNGTHTAMIRRDIEEGLRGGVQATPIFAIGLTERGSLRAMRVIIGAQPYNAFKEAIEAVLATPSGDKLP
jgi:protein-disulfide isomerase